VHPLIDDLFLDADLGFCERALGRLLVADLPCEDVVVMPARAVRAGGLAGEILAQHRRAVGQRGRECRAIAIARADRPLARGPAHEKLGAERQHHRRHVVAGVAVRDIAADRAAVTHLRVGDLQRRLAQDRHPRRQ
jgi:hypothetical protein